MLMDQITDGTKGQADLLIDSAQMFCIPFSIHLSFDQSID